MAELSLPFLPTLSGPLARPRPMKFTFSPICRESLAPVLGPSRCR